MNQKQRKLSWYYVMENGETYEIDENYFAFFSPSQAEDMCERLEVKGGEQFYGDIDGSIQNMKKSFSRLLEKIAAVDKKNPKGTKEKLKNLYKLPINSKRTFVFKCFDERYVDHERIWLDKSCECDKEDRWLAMYNIYNDILKIQEFTTDFDINANAAYIESRLLRLLHNLSIEKSTNKKEIRLKRLSNEQVAQNERFVKELWGSYVEQLKPSIYQVEAALDALIDRMNDLEENTKNSTELALLNEFGLWKNKWMRYIKRLEEGETLEEIEESEKTRWIVDSPSLVDWEMIEDNRPWATIASKERKEQLILERNLRER